MVEYIEVKSILSRLREKDNFFGISYNMNLYRGCQHGCIYCDTRSDCYGIGDISRISVKKNALALLPHELKSRRKAKGTIGTGSMNDPYMPLEAETQLIRQALQIIAGYSFPVHIITKSDLICRDIDVLKEISKTYAAVSFTITTNDDQLAQKLEPHACSSSSRFRTIEQLAKNGIYTGVTLMPMLPWLTDSENNLRALMQQAKDSGASYVMAMFGTTLRKGSREYFYNALDHTFPGIRSRYENQFGDQYICNSPNYRKLLDIYLEECARLSLEQRITTYTLPPDPQLSLF